MAMAIFLNSWTHLCIDAGKWQPLDKIRILMGSDTTHRTRKALLEVVRSRAVAALDGSIEADKEANPFLRGVHAILDALRSGKIECRVYDKDKFSEIKRMPQLSQLKGLRVMKW